MRITKHYYCEYNEELYRALLEAHVQFDHDLTLNWLVFDLFDDDPNIEKLRSVLPKAAFGRYIFSDYELKNSEWLLMRSTNGKLDDKNTEKTFALSCQYEKQVANRTVLFAHHRKQVAPYEFSVPIKWGRNHFCSSVYGGFYHIFCDDVAMNLIQRQGFTGISFLPVTAYKKGCKADNIHQIFFEAVLPDEALLMDDGFQINKCPLCGKVQYACNMLSRIRVRKEFLGSHDLYTTNELFWDGFADPYLIVSNRVYTVLTENKIARNLEFQPLLVI